MIDAGHVRRVTRQAREYLPEGVVDAVRQAARGWGWLTADLRMFPAFVIVGAQRCGTTTLYRLLSDHPSVVRPTMSKGVGYFDVNYGKGSRWYRSHFPIALPASVRRRGENPLTFESSGYYCYHPLAGRRMGNDLTGIRLVMMVRDPVERAYSAYKHEAARGFETETFERALELEPQRLSGEVERILANPDYESHHHRHNSYVARGQYAEQIVRLREAVGPEHVYVMDADYFFANPRREYTALTDWLGMRRSDPSRVEQWNARPGTPMAKHVRERLVAHFAPHDEALRDLTGRSPSWR